MGTLPNIIRQSRGVEALLSQVTKIYQTANTVEQFSNSSWVLAPALFHDFSPGIYVLGYKVTHHARISGTGTNRPYSVYSVLKESAFGVVAVPNTAPGFSGGDTASSESGYIQNDTVGGYTHVLQWQDIVKIESPTRLSHHFAKTESGGGSIGVQIRADNSNPFGGATTYSSYMFYKKLGEL